MAKKQCKTPEGKAPTRAAYGKMIAECGPLCRKLKRIFARTRDGEPLPPPHEWPVYLAPCWRQAYNEAVAMRLVAETYLALEAAMKSAYMPPYILAMYIANYNNAKTAYLAAWGAMEDCLDTIV